ncbi:MAG: sigma-54-dependent Fis family transcriptional regulator [Verrucomicrobia bacterium]|nr:MAG: sigma-54-dependent Fis family transcriptional regulator [Verrucomicrobiota bacterium]
MTAHPILLIEDEHALGTALSFLVRRMGHLPTLVASGAAGLAAVADGSFAAVVLDIGLPDMSGLKVLENMRQLGTSVPVLMITAHATLGHAIHAQKSGATAYLTKPLDLRQFEQTLGAMLASALPLAAASADVPATRAATLIGAAACLRETFIGIARACAGDVPSLITGPSGSGKTLTAAVIHAHGPRASQALAFVACSRLNNAAAFEEHRGGTIVLEEVTDLAPALQTRLAAWLASAPDGHPRLLATSALDPRQAVADGRLREDLYYALTTLTIPLPPLHERSGDIPALSGFFLGVRGSGPAPQLTAPVLAALQAYVWPGNVRELRHVLDYAATLSGGGPVFLSHLPAHVAAAAGPATGASSPAAPGELAAALGRWLDAQLALPAAERPGYEAMLERVEAVMLRYLLDKHESKPTHMAAALGMHRATLRQKLRRAGLQRGEE